MTDVEENTEEEYYPPEGSLPSLRITLEQAKNQYQYHEDAKQSLETKGSISLTLGITLITIISSFNFILIPIILISISLLFSILSIFPTTHLVPGPTPEDYYKFSRNPKEKAKDILLLSYIEPIEKSKKLNKWKGYFVWVSFILNGIGMLTYAYLI